MVWWRASWSHLLCATTSPETVVPVKRTSGNDFFIFICCLSDFIYTFFPPIIQCTRDKMILIISIIPTSLLLSPRTLTDSPVLSTKRTAPCLLWLPHKPLPLFTSLTQRVLFCSLKPLTFISQDEINASVVWCCWHGYLPMWWMAVITCRRN